VKPLQSTKMDRVPAQSVELPDPPRVRAGEVYVFKFLLNRPTVGDLELLDSQERERARRFAFERDRQRFVAAHARVRRTLAAYLNRPPESVRFSASRYGKPQIANPPIDLRFNLSHAGNVALLAVALSREVGIDIEQERPIEVLPLAQRFFSKSEFNALCNLPATERQPAFFRCWTRKEAFIKALGAGLFFALDDFEVSIQEAESDQLLRACAVAPDELLRWRIRSVPAPAGYCGAVAAGPGDWHVVRWRADME